MRNITISFLIYQHLEHYYIKLV